MNTSSSLSLGFRPLLAALLVFALVGSVSAQDTQDTVKRNRVTIVVEDGRVLVDGEEVAKKDGVIVLRVDPDGDEVTVVQTTGPHFMWRGDDDEPGAAFFHFDKDDIEGMDGERKFEVKMRSPLEMRDLDLGAALAPMAKAFRLGGDGMTFRWHEESGEVARLEMQSHRLAQQARRAEGEERQRLERELDETLDQIFDLKLELLEKQQADLQEELGDTRGRLEERRAARNEMIERRKKELLGEEDALEW